MFNNNALFCVGTGRMGLALRAEYQRQLEKVQRELGFRYIRGHGLFHEDMAIYNEYEENGEIKAEYNFSYLDQVFDMYLSLGIKPFVELGFMPEKLASGDQTVFYWKGNVTPPKDYGKWAALVSATVSHLLERYGVGEVVTWPFEVWNEPNLEGFWQNADMAEYFKLYGVTAKAVKACDARLRVGGPAICGVDDERWLGMFLEHCAENKLPLDFVTRHAYAAEPPDKDGRYYYQELRPPEVLLEELNVSRRIIDSFPEYKGMEMHLTEFNTSYSPLCPIHDTNLNAAYIARLLSELGDTCASYSYWTFGDVFEETGPAFTPFSGGFGLLANGMIPKPTYWIFRFFKDLKGEPVFRDGNCVITRDACGSLNGVAWNLSGEELALKLPIGIEDGQYLLVTRTVDEEACNPLKNWLDMGSPPSPTAARLELLRECARPKTGTARVEAKNGAANLKISVKTNGVTAFKLKHITEHADRGFCPERIPGTGR